MSTAQRLQVRTTDRGTEITVLCPELDEEACQGLGGEIFEAARRAHGGRVTLDLGVVTFLTSTMLGKLVVLNKRLRDEGVHLSLRDLNAQVYQVFEIALLTELLDVCPKDAPAAPAEGKA